MVRCVRAAVVRVRTCVLSLGCTNAIVLALLRLVEAAANEKRAFRVCALVHIPANCEAVTRSKTVLSLTLKRTLRVRISGGDLAVLTNSARSLSMETPIYRESK